MNRLLRFLSLAPFIILPALFAQSVHYSYDELGRVVGVVDQNGNAAQYSYDANGNILSITRYTSSQVAVLGFTPSSASVGTTVTISGINFSATASSDTVSFNGTAASVISATPYQMVVAVPSGATTGPISVTVPLGSASSSSNFTVLASTKPAISGISPNVGMPGSSVTVSGTNFAASYLNDLTTVNSLKKANVSSGSTTSLAMTVPSGVGSGPVTLATPAGSTTSAGDLFIPPSPYTTSKVSVAQRVSSGTATTVAIPTAGNLGMLTFAGTANQRASLVLSSSSFAGCSSVIGGFLKPDGTSLASTSLCNINSGFLDSQLLPMSGFYTTVIEPQGSTTGSLSATVYTFSDQVGTISPSSSLPGSPVSVSTSSPGQNGHFTFTGTSGKQVSLSLSGSTYSIPCGACNTIVASILKPDGTTLGSAAVAFNSSTAFVDSLTLPTTGTYTVLDDPQGISTGGVSETLFAFNDQTGSISPGTPQTVAINTPGQNSLLTFSATAGQQTSLQLSGSSYTVPCGYCTVLVGSVLKPDGTSLASASIPYNGNAAFVDSTTIPTTGTYTAKIDPQGTSTGSLSAEVFIFNDQTGTITPGTSQSVAISTPGQNSKLTFSATAGQQVSLNMTSSTYSSPCGYCATVTGSILKPDGTTLGSASVAYNSNTAFVDSTTIPTTGTYTVFTNPQGNSTGSLTTLASLFNDQTGSITPGTAQAVAVSAPGQNALLTFSATSGQKVSLSLTSSTYSTPCSYCTKLVANILNPSGTSIGSTSIAWNGNSASINPITLSATGTYTLKVDPQGNSTGSLSALVTLQ